MVGASDNDRLVWIDCEMTGLDLAIDELVEIAVVVTDFELRPLDPGFSDRHQARRLGARAHERLRHRRCTRSPGCSTEIPAGRQRRRSRVPGARVHPAVRAPRGQGAAGGQHDRHRPDVPREVHAAGRPLAALPQRRRVEHQRAQRGAGIRARTSTRRPRTAVIAPSPTSANPSANSPTTAQAVFVPEPGPTSDGARAAAAAAVSSFAPDV